MSPFTFLSGLHERWWIEQGHRDLKQQCGLRQLFVWSKDSVNGLTKLLNLLKNFILVKVAESGFSMRTFPFESIIENEFAKFEQDLIKTALHSGVLGEVS